MMENEMTVNEKLLLLAIRPGKGGISGMSSQDLDFTLLGATFLELTLSRNVDIKDKRIELISGKTSSPLYAYLLEKLAKSTRPRKISRWLSSVSISKRKVRAGIYDSLVQKREIKLEDRHFLFFNWKKPFLMPGNHVFYLIDKIKTTISQGPGFPEDIYLLALLEPARLLRRIYPERTMRKQARLKIKGFQSGNQVSQAMRQAIETAGAVRTSVIMSIAAAHASHTG